MIERRNPYLILGLDFAASPKEASIAFAKTTKRIRRGNTPFTMEDVTWALHQIEQASTDPLINLNVYRVPADPTVFRAPTALGAVTGPPMNLDRQSPTDPTVLTQLRAKALTDELSGPLLAQALGPFVDAPEP